MSDETIFRGHSFEEKYALVPSALRPGAFDHIGGVKAISGQSAKIAQLINEYSVLIHFFRRADNEGLPLPDCERLRNGIAKIDMLSVIRNEDWLPADLVEIAALAQHYGIPTRLLDWTKDINIAIYFALSDYLKLEARGNRFEIWGLNISQVFNSYGGDIPIKIIQPNYHGNPNLAAQKGIFTMWKYKKEFIKERDSIKLENDDIIDRRSLDILIEEYLANFPKDSIDKCGKLLYHISVPIDDIPSLYRYIKNVSCDASHLFPGYYGIVQSIKEEELILPSVKKNGGKTYKTFSYFD